MSTKKTTGDKPAKVKGSSSAKSKPAAKAGAKPAAKPAKKAAPKPKPAQKAKPAPKAAKPAPKAKPPLKAKPAPKVAPKAKPAAKVAPKPAPKVAPKAKPAAKVAPKVAPKVAAKVAPKPAPKAEPAKVAKPAKAAPSAPPAEPKPAKAGVKAALGQTGPTAEERHKGPADRPARPHRKEREPAAPDEPGDAFGRGDEEPEEGVDDIEHELDDEVRVGAGRPKAGRPPKAKPKSGKRGKRKAGPEEPQARASMEPPAIPAQYPGRAFQSNRTAQVGFTGKRLAPIGPSALMGMKEEADEDVAFVRQPQPNPLQSLLPPQARGQLLPLPPYKKTPDVKKSGPKQKYPPDKMYLLVGLKLGHLWIGRKVHQSVPAKTCAEFDWRLILNEEERCGCVVGFWVPREVHTLSPRDETTLKGWSAAFGKSMVVIFAGKKSLTAHVFDKPDTEIRPLPIVSARDEEFVIGVDKP